MVQSIDPMFFSVTEPVISFDKSSLMWRIENERICRVIQYDIQRKGFYTTSFLDKRLGREFIKSPSPEGFLKLQTGELIDLGEDFELGGYAEKERKDIKGGGVYGLVIHALGVGKNKGIRIEINYDIYPGDEPWTTKWFSVQTERELGVVEEICLDRLSLKERDFARYAFEPYSTLSVFYSDDLEGGIFASVGTYNWKVELEKDKGILEIGYHPNIDLDKYLKMVGGDTAKICEGVFDGDKERAVWIYELFLIHRWLKANCFSIKPMYEVWFRGEMRDGYSWDENLLKKLIPIVKECGFKIFYLIPDRWEFRDLEPSVFGLAEGDSRAVEAYPNGFSKDNPESLPGACREAGLEFGIHAFGFNYPPDDFPTVDRYAEALANFVRESGATFLWYEDRAGAEWWRHAFKRLSEKVREANPEIAIARTWERLVELHDMAEGAAPWDAEGQPYLNYYKAIWPDQFFLIVNQWREFCVKWWFRPSFLTLTQMACPLFNAWPLRNRGLQKVTNMAGLEFMLASTAFTSPMLVAGRIEETSEEERRMIRKWVEWNWENREWLQYNQPLEIVETNLTGVDGIMHLRNLYKGRYGYIGVWNKDRYAKAKISLRIDPRKYMIDMEIERLKVIDWRKGRTIDKWRKEGETVVIEELEIPPRDFLILELKGK